MKIWIFVLLAALCAWGGAHAAKLQEVSEAAIEELGTTYGSPQMNGFVFVDGRYLAPPYTVTRRGNGIFINRIQVEQPAVWPRGGGDAPKAVDEDGDFEVVEPEPEPMQAETEKEATSIDDLFADEDEPAAPAPKAVQPRPVAGGAEESGAQVAERIDKMRKSYEQALARGEIFFFGQRHQRVNGNYGTARTLMGVLPGALRNAVSAQDLQQRLRAGGVYFVDHAICAELFKNKSSFPLLEDRLRKIKSAEAEEARKKTSTRTR